MNSFRALNHWVQWVPAFWESNCILVNSDSRFVDENLCSKLLALGTDLVITEGMGRAVHTNFTTKYTCDSMKIAVIKNQWLAQRLGGEMFSVIFKFETV